jgi:hypothetical protein
VVGSTLSQLEKNGHDHPIHFTNKQLTLEMKNYILTKQKGLITIFSLKKLCHYLLQYKAKIMIDHKALHLFDYQVQSKWLTCSMVVVNGRI